MARRTRDNYTRQMADQPIEVSYRFDIEFQEEDEDHSWSTFRRGKWQATDDATDALEYAVECQQAHPSRDFRIVRRVERVSRNEPFHPAFIRGMAEKEAEAR